MSTEKPFKIADKVANFDLLIQKGLLDKAYTFMTDIFSPSNEASWEAVKEELLYQADISPVWFEQTKISQGCIKVSTASEVMGMMDVTCQYDYRKPGFVDFRYFRIGNLCREARSRHVGKYFVLWLMCRLPRDGCVDCQIYNDILAPVPEGATNEMDEILSPLAFIESMLEAESVMERVVTGLRDCCGQCIKQDSRIDGLYKLRFVVTRMYPGLASTLDSWFEFSPTSDVGIAYKNHAIRMSSTVYPAIEHETIPSSRFSPQMVLPQELADNSHHALVGLVGDGGQAGVGRMSGTAVANYRASLPFAVVVGLCTRGLFFTFESDIKDSQESEYTFRHPPPGWDREIVSHPGRQS